MMFRQIVVATLLIVPVCSSRADEVTPLVEQFYHGLSVGSGTAREAAERMIEIGRSETAPETEARGWLRLGFLDARPNNEESGWRECVSKGVDLASQTQGITRAEVLMFAGYTKARADNDFDTALSEIARAISLGRELRDDSVIAMAHLMSSEILRVQGSRLKRAREQALRGLFFAEATGLESILRMALKRVLLEHEASGFYAQAIPYTRQLLTLDPGSDTAKRILYMAGENPEYLAELTGLIESMRKKNFEEHGKKSKLAKLQLRFGVYCWNSDPEKASLYLDEARDRFDEIKDEGGALHARIVRSLVLGDEVSAEEAFDSFASCFEDGLDPFGVISTKLHALDVASFFEKHGAWEQASQWREKELDLFRLRSAANDVSGENAARLYFDEEMERRHVKLERRAMAAERAGFEKERARFSRTTQLLWALAGVAVLSLFLTRYFLVARHRAHLVREVARQTESLKAAKSEAEQARDRAETADRAKSEFLACMNHELRNPLNAILGSCQLLQRDQVEQDVGHFEIIQASSEHLLQLVNNVLDVSSIEQGESILHERDFDLHELSYFVQRILAQAASSKGLVFDCEIDPRVPRFVRGDDAKLRQILINLCSNAIKFTTRGSVRVHLKSKVANNDQIMLSARVVDTGPGIPADELESMFEPFRQSVEARKTRAGTGLGLYICKTFAESMGGAIHARSELEVGSEFKLTIPLQTTDSEDPLLEAATTTDELEQQQLETVLVVDDSQANLTVLTALIETMGHQAHSADNKQTAMAALESAKPGVVLLDLHMPDANGFDVLEAMRATEAGRDARIIALTGDAIDGVRKQALDAGFDGFLAKPVRLRHIDHVLRERVLG